MPECEICGKLILTEKRARIDNIVLTVCEECAKLGEEMPTAHVIGKRAEKEYEMYESHALVQNFGKKVKSAREKRGMSQPDLAEKIGERASVIKRVEHNEELDDQTMRKLERFFGFRLYEEPEHTGHARINRIKSKGDPSGLTLGDVAGIRTRKK